MAAINKILTKSNGELELGWGLRPATTRNQLAADIHQGVVVLKTDSALHCIGRPGPKESPELGLLVRQIHPFVV